MANSNGEDYYAGRIYREYANPQEEVKEEDPTWCNRDRGLDVGAIQTEIIAQAKAAHEEQAQNHAPDSTTELEKLMSLVRQYGKMCSRWGAIPVLHF